MKSSNCRHGWITLTLPFILYWWVTIHLGVCRRTSTDLHIKIHSINCLIGQPLLFFTFNTFPSASYLAEYAPMQPVVKFYKSVNYFGLPWWSRPGKGIWYVWRIFQSVPLLLIKLFSVAEYLTGQLGNSKILSRWS